jgi:predicted negative regulator of RcsB-dependent stress response
LKGSVEVVPDRIYNALRDLSEDENEDKSHKKRKTDAPSDNDPVVEVVQMLSSKHKTRAKIEKKQLGIEQKRLEVTLKQDDQAAVKAKIDLEIARVKLKLNKDDAARQLQLEAVENSQCSVDARCRGREARFQRALLMLKMDDAEVMAAGLRIMSEVDEEEKAESVAMLTRL